MNKWPSSNIFKCIPFTEHTLFLSMNLKGQTRHECEDLWKLYLLIIDEATVSTHKVS